MSRQPIRSPEYARAIELLRGGMHHYDVSAATNIPAPVLKKWAKKAGIPLRQETPEEHEARQRRNEIAKVARRARSMTATAPKERGRILGHHRQVPREQE